MKSILKRMKQILDIYRFVRIVDKKAHELEKNNPNGLLSSGANIRHVATLVVKNQYIESYKSNNLDVYQVCVDAIKKGYLEGFNKNIDGKKIDFVRLTTEGRALNDHILIIPIGLWYAWFEKYGRFLAGLGIGTLIVPVLAFIKWAIELIIGL